MPWQSPITRDRIIALDEDAEVQELLIEGINRVFEARGKHRIA